MEDQEINDGVPSEWDPMSNPGDIALVGKAQEELGECIAALARCLIQGIFEAEPKTGKVNKEWLEDEIADVYAMLQLIDQRFGLDSIRVYHRQKLKQAYKRKWLKHLDGG